TNDAEVLQDAHGRLTVSARLAMNGPYKEAHVTGDVRVRAGVLYIPPSDNKNLVGAGDPALFSVLDTAVMADRELFPSQSPLLANLRMDVNLSVDRYVFVRSREANVVVYTVDPIGVRVYRSNAPTVIDSLMSSL